MGKFALEELSSNILRAAEALLGPAVSEPGKGLLVFVRADREDDLKNLAILVSQKMSKDKPAPIYVVQGHVRGKYGWPFSRIKKGPRLKLNYDGQIVTETGGLIFPQDRRIVLLVEYFDCLEPRDQRAYAHLVDGEGEESALHSGSILIGGLRSDNPGQLEDGAANRGLFFPPPPLTDLSPRQLDTLAELWDKGVTPEVWELVASAMLKEEDIVKVRDWLKSG